MEENTDSVEICMEQVSQYYDHYKDTFEQQKANLEQRNRLTLFLLLFAIILIGLIFDPLTLNKKLNTIIGAQIENLAFDFQIINTGVLLVTFWYLLQYYMIVLQIEKMYNYLAECEARLENACPKFPINREGAYYLKLYPWLKNIADYIFVLGFPLGFIAISIAKIINGWTWKTELRFVDFIFLGLIILFSLLYLSHRKLREEYWDKNRYNFKWNQRFAGYLRFREYSETKN